MFFALKIRKSILKKLFLEKFDFFVKFVFLDLVKFIVVDNFLISLPIISLLISPLSVTLSARLPVFEPVLYSIVFYIETTNIVIILKFWMNFL